LDNSLDIGDWVVASNGVVGQLWIIRPMYCQINTLDSEGFKAPAMFAIDELTKITKEVADIMRVV
jgi:hypothetical protein